VKEFKEYTGEYEKTFYDVLAEDGFVYTQVWPNAGYFKKGGLTLCSDEERKIIFIRESPIHAAEISMDNKILLSVYNSIVLNEESIKDYIEIRRPIADEEHRIWEVEQEEERAKHYLKNPIMYLSSGEWGEQYVGIRVNKPYKKPIDKLKRKAQRLAKKKARQRAKRGRK